MKKILALVLAVVLVMGLATTAFAVNPIEEINGTDSKDVKVTYVADDEVAVYRVDITWGSMEFTYTEANVGTWQPESHTYTGNTEAKWECEEADKTITVANHSNVGVDVELAFKKSADTAYANVTGSLSKPTIELNRAEANTEFNTAPSGSSVLTLGGTIADQEAGTYTVGSVTVTLN